MKKKVLKVFLLFTIVVGMIQFPQSASAATCDITDPTTLGDWDLNGDGTAEHVVQEKNSVHVLQPYITVVDYQRGCSYYQVGTNQFTILSAAQMDYYGGLELTVYTQQATGLIMVIRHYNYQSAWLDMRWEPSSINTNPIYGWVTVEQMNATGLYHLVSETNAYADTSNNWHAGGVKIYTANDNVMHDFTLPLDVAGLPTSNYNISANSYLTNTDGYPGYEVYVDYTYSCIYYGCTQGQWKKRDIVNFRLGTVTSGAISSSDTQAPSVPANLTVVSYTTNSVTLSWTGSSDNVGVTGYIVYRDEAEVGSTTGTSYTAGGLAQGRAYTYTVRAKDAAGNISGASNQATYSLPDTQAPSAPANLDAAYQADNSLKLTWNPSTDNVGVTGYVVYQDGQQLPATANTFYSITGVAPGTTHSFTVRAYDAAGNYSGASNTTTYSRMDWRIADLNGDGKADLFKFWNDGSQVTSDAHLSTGSSFAIQRWATQQGGMWNGMKWFTGDFNGDGMKELAKLWNENGQFSADVHISSGSSFALERWATQQGGYSDAQKWFTGDFNGDGKTDLMKLWGDSGQVSADVHISSGSSFALKRWATQQGGYWDAQRWFTGDFNGDGKTDLMKLWNDNGQFSADVHISTGSSFTLQRWATQQGGYSDAQKWFTGDFNGDGKTDLMKLWGDSGQVSADVHISSGSSFALQRWATQQGGYWDAQRWYAGDFNGDGKTDMMKLWGDSGQVSADVHISSGSSFALQRWATQQGGYWEGQQWNVADFNGDGKTDLMKFWMESGQITADVHSSTGGSFGLQRWATQQGGIW